MIDRIYLAKLSDSSTAPAVASEVHDALVGLEGALEVQVGLPADAASERSWDLSLVVSCADADKLSEVLLGESFGHVYGRLEAQSDVVKAWSFSRL